MLRSQPQATAVQVPLTVLVLAPMLMSGLPRLVLALVLALVLVLVPQVAP